MSLVIAKGSPRRSSYLYTDAQTNQSSVLGSAIIGGRSRDALELAYMRFDYTASAVVGVRQLRLNVLDENGEVRHTRDLGNATANDVVAESAMPFSLPHQFESGQPVIEAQYKVAGSVDAGAANPNMTVSALDTALPLYAEAAPAAYPVARGTRVYGVSNVVVKDAADTVTFVEGDDYTVDYERGKVTFLTGGSGGIGATDDLVIDFDYASLTYETVGQNDSIRLPSDWTVVVEDTADIDDAGDVLNTFFHGRYLTT